MSRSDPARYGPDWPGREKFRAGSPARPGAWGRLGRPRPGVRRPAVWCVWKVCVCVGGCPFQPGRASLPPLPHLLRLGKEGTCFGSESCKSDPKPRPFGRPFQVTPPAYLRVTPSNSSTALAAKRISESESHRVTPSHSDAHRVFPSHSESLRGTSSLSKSFRVTPSHSNPVRSRSESSREFAPSTPLPSRS